MRDGWYISTNFLVHYVEDDHYICNESFKITPLKDWKKENLLEYNTCKKCEKMKL